MTKGKSDPAGLRDEVYVAEPQDQDGMAALFKAITDATPQARIDALRQNEELADEADRLESMLKDGEADLLVLMLIDKAEKKLMRLRAEPYVEHATETQEQRRDGGKKTGKKQHDTKRARIERCNRIAAKKWADATPARRWSKYNRVDGFAKPIREELRREWLRDGNEGDPDWLPSDSWVKDNVTHPGKIRSS